MSESKSVIIPMLVPADALWELTFGSAFESFPWWTRVNYLGDADWDKPGLVELSGWSPESDGYDEEADEVTKVISLQDIVDAYTWYVNAGYKTMYEDFDSVYSDVVIQKAFYGSVIYG